MKKISKNLYSYQNPNGKGEIIRDKRDFRKGQVLKPLSTAEKQWLRNQK